MRIALVRSTLHKGSGQTTHVIELAKGLQILGHDVTIISREIQFQDIDINTQEFNFYENQIPFFRNIIFPFRCKNFLKQFDLIHTQYHPCIFVGNVAQKWLKKPHIWTYHGFAPVDFWKSFHQRAKMIDHRIGTFLALRFGVDRIITVSQFLKKELVNLYKVNENWIQVIYNGVDSKKFHPAHTGDTIKRKYHLQNSPIVLFFGRLAPHKGVHLLINAIPFVLKEKPQTKFLIAGAMRYDMLNLLKMVEHFNIHKSAIFTGFVPDRLVPDIYGCCDIFCYPSLWEGFGLPLVEASATGKPVVALNTSAIPEIVENRVTGLLVDPHPENIAEGIITLLTNRKMRHKMGANARKRVLRLFSWQKMVEKTIKVYQTVLNNYK